VPRKITQALRNMNRIDTKFRALRAAGLKVATFDRPSALLASEVPATNACMLVDVHLPEMNGIPLGLRTAAIELFRKSAVGEDAIPANVAEGPQR